MHVLKALASAAPRHRSCAGSLLWPGSCAGSLLWLTIPKTSIGRRVEHRNSVLKRDAHRSSRGSDETPATAVVGQDRDRFADRGTGHIGCKKKQENKHSRELKEKHRRIRQAATADEIYAIVKQASKEGHELDALAVMAAFHRMAILAVESQRLARISGTRTKPANTPSSKRAMHTNAASSTDTARGASVPFSILGGGGGGGMQMLEELVVAKISDFGPHHCALTLWSIAKLSKLSKVNTHTHAVDAAREHTAVEKRPSVYQKRPSNHTRLGGYQASSEVLQILIDAAQANAPAANPRHIANILWACATLGLQPPPPLLQALSQRVTSTSSEFQNQAVTNMLWALASLRVIPPQDMCEALLHRAALTLPDSSAQGVANLAWALGTLSLQPLPHLLSALDRRAVETSGDLTGQGE